MISRNCCSRDKLHHLDGSEVPEYQLPAASRFPSVVGVRIEVFLTLSNRERLDLRDRYKVDLG